VVYYHDLIPRGMDVELDRVRAALEGSLKGGNRVLRQLALGSAMSDSFHDAALPRVYCSGVHGVPGALEGRA
jgi:hypothetical protein